MSISSGWGLAYGAFYCGRERDTLLGNNVHTGGVQGEEEEGLFKANAVKEEEEEEEESVFKASDLFTRKHCP